jgi:hypothetical protein
MTAPLMLTFTANERMQNRHSLEQEEEMESEQLTAKEACINWK